MNSVNVTFILETFKIKSDAINLKQCTKEYKQMVSDETLGLRVAGKTPLLFYPVYLHFYLDERFKNRKNHVVVIADDTHFSDGEYVINESISLSGQVDKYPIENDSKLCVQAQVTALSETGVPCRINFGRVVINLATTTSEKHTYQLKMHSVEGDPTKSIIVINKLLTTKQTISDSLNDNKEMFSIEDLNSNLVKNMKEMRSYMENYVKKSSKCDAMLSQFMPGSSIKCPTNPSQVTFDNTDIPLPLASFTMSEPLKTTKSFWTQQLLIYATRYLISNPDWYRKNYQKIEDSRFILEEFKMVFLKSSVSVKASMAIDIIAQYIQMKEYITDYTVNEFNEKDGIEDFGDVIFSDSGDCEDLAYGIYLLLESFLNQFGGSSDGSVFSEAARILSGFSSFIVIDGVTSNNVQNAPKESSYNDKNAPPNLSGMHAALKLIPYNLLHTYMKNWSPEHSLTKHIKLQSDEFYQKNEDIKPKDMIVLIGEGTGMLPGGICEDKMSLERKFVYNSFIMDKVKKPMIPTERSVSPFYQALLFGFTNKYIKSHGIGTFYFSTKEPSKYYRVSNHCKSENLTYGKGCTFGDFINNTPAITVIPNGCGSDNPESREFDSFIINMMDRVSKTRVPTPTLVLNKSKDTIINIEKYDAGFNPQFFNDNDVTPIVQHAFSKFEFNELLQLANLAHNHSGRKEYRKKRKPYGVVSVYLLEDYVDDTFLNEVKNYFIENKYSIVGDIQIFKEYHTDNFYVFRMDFIFYE